MNRVYVYQGELYCDDCGANLLSERAAAGVIDDGDADHFPQMDWGGESDFPYWCEHCGTLLPIQLTDYGFSCLTELLVEALTGKPVNMGVVEELCLEYFGDSIERALEYRARRR